MHKRVRTSYKIIKTGGTHLLTSQSHVQFLTQSRMEQLTAMGFSWTGHVAHGQQYCEIMKDVLAQGDVTLDDINIKYVTEHGIKLGIWKVDQQKRYNRYCRGVRGARAISDTKFEQLTELGFKYTRAGVTQEIEVGAMREMSEADRSRQSSLLVAQATEKMKKSEDFARMVGKEYLPFLHEDAARTLLARGAASIPRNNDEDRAAMNDLIRRCTEAAGGEYTIVADVLHDLHEQRELADFLGNEVQRENDALKVELEVERSEKEEFLRLLESFGYQVSPKKRPVQLPSSDSRKRQARKEPSTPRNDWSL